MFIRFSRSNKPFPATSNALVVRHLVIHQTASDVVLGFIGWAIGQYPKNDPDPIAGVTGWALSLHEAKLLRVTDKPTYELGECSGQSRPGKKAMRFAIRKIKKIP